MGFYFSLNFTQCNIDAVEIDECIANVAKDWFGLKEDDRLRIHIADGLKYIDDAAKAGRVLV